MNHFYFKEIDGPQSFEIAGRRTLCKGGGLVSSIVSTVAGSLISSALLGSQKQANSSNKALTQATEASTAQAKATAKASEEASNAANQKSPDSAAILSSIQQQGKSGQSGTILTGANGVNQGSLTLGKQTLLGS